MSKFKLFYSTDWHAKGKNPSSRIDDYPSTIESKIRTFFRLGEEYGVDAYACGGDMVDSAYLSPQYVTRLGHVINEELEATQKKLYYVLGNHDIIAYNPDSITSTSFGIFLSFVKNMILLSKTPIIMPQGVAITGISSYAQLDKHIYGEDGSIVQHRYRDWVVEETTRPHIHIVHGFLSPKPILEDIPHTVIDEMKHTKATVTLGAHDHTGFPVTKTDNGLVYNPGALGRVFASHAEMKRMPKYVLVTIHEDGTPEIQPIACPVAELGDMVMNRQLLDEKKAKEALLAQSRGDVKELIQGLNIGSIDLRMIVSKYKEKTSSAVYEEAIKRLQL